MDSINCLQYKRIKRNHMIHAKYMALSFVGFGKSFYGKKGMGITTLLKLERAAQQLGRDRAARRGGG